MPTIIFGFLYETDHQLILFFSHVFDNIENRKPTGIIYLDFKKAFDTVPHSLIPAVHALCTFCVVCLHLTNHIYNFTQPSSNVVRIVNLIGY